MWPTVLQYRRSVVAAGFSTTVAGRRQIPSRGVNTWHTKHEQLATRSSMEQPPSKQTPKKGHPLQSKGNPVASTNLAGLSHLHCSTTPILSMSNKPYHLECVDKNYAWKGILIGTCRHLIMERGFFKVHLQEHARILIAKFFWLFVSRCITHNQGPADTRYVLVNFFCGRLTSFPIGVILFLMLVVCRVWLTQPPKAASHLIWHAKNNHLLWEWIFFAHRKF